MIRAYSQRLLPPYTGFVQIAETEKARVQSFDGLSWEFHFLSGNDSKNRQSSSREQGYGLGRGYYRVAHLKNHHLKPYILPTCVDPDEVTECIHQLYEFLSAAQVPFPAADIYEYWLLDGVDESPLALIYSCCEESQISSFPHQPKWTALPHSKMHIDKTAHETAIHEPPVNHRFESLIGKRAGAKPRATWFKRSDNDRDDFPRLLVREDWQFRGDQDLCERYLCRKAPRLLMLQSLSRSDRERLEIASKAYALEVDEYFPMYPEVNDDQLMTTIRVEARLRRSIPVKSSKKTEEPSPGYIPLSKDMRIFDT